MFVIHQIVGVLSDPRLRPFRRLRVACQKEQEPRLAG